jgi:APA family basic amino acid/polyamine antiporter
MGIFRTKSVAQAVQDTEDPEHKFNKVLGPWDLMIFGIGAIIGTGIFVLTGTAAANNAGPAIVISFLIAGIACGLAALCYSEFASSIPVAGSAYTFSYVALGEFLAWIIGWDLILEFLVGAVTVTIGWSGYFTSLLNAIGITLPAVVAGGPGAVLNLPACMIALLLTVIMTVGVQLSSRINIILTAIKLAIVFFFIIVGVFFINPVNWHPFFPPPIIAPASHNFLETPFIQMLLGVQPQNFGWSGIVTGAAVVFFAYIGFDVVATTAEETRNPQRNLPIGILGSLIVCTLLYVLVSFILTGIVPYADLGTPAPMALAFSRIGQSWAAILVSIGTIIGLTAVILIMMMGQSRVFYAMSRDHLLPPWFYRLHPKWKTPYRISILTGISVAALAAFLPLHVVSEMVSIGTLMAFVLVAMAVIILRKTRPDLHRPFRTPWVPFLPIVAILFCIYLMLSLPILTWIRFLVWLALGVVIYFVYSYHHSRLKDPDRDEEVDITGPSIPQTS